MNHIITSLFTILSIILSGCHATTLTQASQTGNPAQAIGTPVTVEGGAYWNITPKMLESLLAKKDFILINVHIPFAGNLPKTDVSIPYDQIDQNLGKLPAEKDAKIVLYCSSGHMSSLAATKLVELGYTNVWNLDGGMSAWRMEGFTIEGTP